MRRLAFIAAAAALCESRSLGPQLELLGVLQPKGSEGGAGPSGARGDKRGAAGEGSGSGAPAGKKKQRMGGDDDDDVIDLIG